MSERDDGGPAFGHGDPTHGGNPGMSLRDWLAGQALAGMWASITSAKSETLGEKHYSALAACAYAQADAMLEARKK